MPVGNVTVPAVMVKLSVVVAGPENAQLPPVPLKTTLLKLELPGVIVLPVVVAVKVMVDVAG